MPESNLLGIAWGYLIKKIKFYLKKTLFSTFWFILRKRLYYIRPKFCFAEWGKIFRKKWKKCIFLGKINEIEVVLIYFPANFYKLSYYLIKIQTQRHITPFNVIASIWMFPLYVVWFRIGQCNQRYRDAEFGYSWPNLYLFWKMCRTLWI